MLLWVSPTDGGGLEPARNLLFFFFSFFLYRPILFLQLFFCVFVLYVHMHTDYLAMTYGRTPTYRMTYTCTYTGRVRGGFQNIVEVLDIILRRKQTHILLAMQHSQITKIFINLYQLLTLVSMMAVGQIVVFILPPLFLIMPCPASLYRGGKNAQLTPI